MASRKVIILVAVNGGSQQDHDGAHIPVTPTDIAEESQRCRAAGAAIVHLHARDPVTRLGTGDPAIFGDIIRQTRARCDILIQTTTGIGLKQDPMTGESVWASHEERLGLLTIEPVQDLVTVPLGTWDFYHPAGAQPVARTYLNTPDFLRKNIGAILPKRVPWEMEIAEIGFLYNALRLADEGVFDRHANNFWLDYLLGYGAMPANARQLAFIADEGLRLFPQAKWEVNATGREQFPMNIVGLALGCDIVRVGFEDNLQLPNGRVAAHNHELVAEMAELVLKMGCNVATADDARQILGVERRHVPA
jgi:3-keto-5-aminohexanoate cleavage enzyme